MAEIITYFYDAGEHPEDKSKLLRWMKIAAVINLLLAFFTLYCFFQGQQLARLIIFLVFLVGAVVFGFIAAGVLPMFHRFARGQHYARIVGTRLEYRFVAFTKIKTISLAGVEAVGITQEAIIFFYPDNKQCPFPSRFIYHADKKLELERILREQFPAPKRSMAGAGN